MKLRNWIERAVGKQWINPPVKIGYRGGRECYLIEFVDGTENEYYIDFDSETIEAVFPEFIPQGSRR